MIGYPYSARLIITNVKVPLINESIILFAENNGCYVDGGS